MHKFSIFHFLADGRVGGPQIRIVRVHTGMQSKDTEIRTVIACPSTQPQKFFDRPHMHHLEVQWHKPKAEQALRSGIAWLLYGMWKDVGTCQRSMRQFPEAIVHINGAILVSAAIAAFIERRKWIWHLNDTSVPRFLALVVRSLIFWGKGKPIAASSAVINYYGLPRNTPVLYPPVEIDVEIDRTEDAIHRVGVMANISPGKGIEEVIEAFALAHKRKPQLRLLIAGRVLENKRWYFESLERRVRELEIVNQVEFSGFISDPLAWMRKLDLFVFSSHFEAAPVALIEALSCGLPIIAGDIPPTREILSDCGILTSLGDTAAMAEAVVEMVENTELRRSLTKKAVARAKQVFSIEVIAEKYCKVYAEIMGEGHDSFGN
jgi:glycosyltransferase involved in cell wall biosynthesis